MEPSKAAMKAALRVLTAISERQEPNHADVDELHWYAPSDHERPVDELVCDAIQRALKDREQKRKAIQTELRERAFAIDSADVPAALPDRETGTLVREHAERLAEYRAVSARLKRLGTALQQATANMMAAEAENYTANTEAARTILESLAGEIDVSGITELLNEHVRLTKHLIADQQALKDRGLK